MPLITCKDCGHQISDTASSCPNCGRPVATRKNSSISIFRIIAVLALAFIILRACASIGDQADNDSTAATQGANSAASNPSADSLPPSESSSGSDSTAQASDTSAAPARPTIVIMDATPAQLYWLYEKNEVSANQLFNGKQVQVTAPVESIDEDMFNNVVLRFGTGVPYESFSATLIDSQRPKAASLNKGDEVTVRCLKISRILDAPIADHCTIITSSAAIQ